MCQHLGEGPVLSRTLPEAPNVLLTEQRNVNFHTVVLDKLVCLDLSGIAFEGAQGPGVLFVVHLSWHAHSLARAYVYVCYVRV